VTTVSGYQQSSNGDIYVASGSADSTVKIWRIVDATGMSEKINKSFENIFFSSSYLSAYH
jgi:WD40 repeat protein